MVANVDASVIHSGRNGADVTGLDGKLAGISSTELYSDIISVEATGNGIMVGIRLSPRENFFSAKDVVAMSLFGYVQRACVAAGSLRTLDWRRVGNSVLVLDYGVEGGRTLKPGIAEVSDVGERAGAHLIAVSPLRRHIGDYRTGSLIGYWARQLTISQG